MSAEHPIKNLINGNIAEAKKGAKRYSHAALELAAYTKLELSPSEAKASADYLKGRCTWEQYCEVSGERRNQGLAQEVKDEAARCDPAAVYNIAVSLDRFAHASKFRGNMSEAYNGGDQFYREIMKVGEAFERWACLHVDFAQTADVWPYMLRDKFADALEAYQPGAILALDKLTADDFAGIAAKLKLTLLK